MPPAAMRLEDVPQQSLSSAFVESNNNNASGSELELLAKLEEANRLYESDAKSLNSLSGGSAASGHSRKSSDTSQISLTSGTSSTQDRDEDEKDLWVRWGLIVNDWENIWKKQNFPLREMVRRGIPVHFRAIVWQLLCGATEASEKKQYADYIKTKSPCEKVIRRDIARTYPEHEFFKEKDGLGQESLFNVIKAYSLHDREVGYCQGSGFIVGLLLMQMPEEEAFAVLVKIMEDYRMRDMFKPSMAELGLCMYQLENLVAEYLPELNQHFQSQNFHTSMYASSWFLTLFTTALTLPLACRIMDVFLSEGMEIIFKVALAMLTLGKDELMSLDMEGMLKYFQKELPLVAEADPESLMQLAYGMKYNAKKMKKLEKEYQVIKTKEQEEMAELKRLRLENKQLRHRCEMLEDESKALADRLVRGQVSRAEEEETTFVVQRELDVLRHTHLETTHQLALANERIRSLSLMMEETHTSRQSSMDEITIKQEQLQQREEMIECLQEELVKVRLREAENDALIRDLRSRIHELEEDKKTLREITPDNSVAHLQEELIAVKLREAEANLSLKDLRQRVSELGAQWQRHLQDHKQEPTSSGEAHSTPKKLLFWENRHNETQKLEEELITTRIREMETLTEAKELRLKVMELETQVQVSTNQLRRQDDEIKKQRENLEVAELKDREAAARLLEEQRRYSDLESKMRDELMKAKISDAEKAQAIAELSQKISQLELKSQEIATEGELRIHSVDDSDKVRELQDKVADLQAEAVRKRNEDLKSKWQKLEKERSTLDEKINLNQVGIVTEKNHLNDLLKELKKLKLQTSEATHRLKISNEQIDVIQSIIEETENFNSDSITRLRPIRENLLFKWNVVECLEKMLTETRLKIAEQDEIITELIKREYDLQNEITTLKAVKPSTVSKWQEEFLDAKIKEADVILEFDKIKRNLANLNADVQDQILETRLELENGPEDFFSIKFNLRDKFNEQIKEEEVKSITNTVELQNEIDFLKIQIRKLENIKKDISRQIDFSEDVKVHLYEVRTSICYRQLKTDQETIKAIENRKKIEEKMGKDILKIQNGIDQKSDQISILVEEIEKLQIRNQEFTHTTDESMSISNENRLSELHMEIEQLEDEIKTMTATV